MHEVLGCAERGSMVEMGGEEMLQDGKMKVICFVEVG